MNTPTLAELAKSARASHLTRAPTDGLPKRRAVIYLRDGKPAPSFPPIRTRGGGWEVDPRNLPDEVQAIARRWASL